MKKRVLVTHQGLARLAAGQTLAQVPHEEIEVNDDGTIPGATVQDDPPDDPPDDDPEEEEEEEQTAAGGDPATDPVQEPAEQTSLVSFLKEENGKKDKRIEELQVAVAGALADLEKVQGQLEQTQTALQGAQNDTKAFRAGVVAYTKMLQTITSGGAVAGLEQLPDTALLQQLNAAETQFKDTFQTGQHSVPAGDAAVNEQTVDEEARKAGLVPLEDG